MINEKGMLALADLNGLPMGVITAAFKNIFPPNAEVTGADPSNDLLKGISQTNP